MDPHARPALRFRIDAHTQNRLEALRLLLLDTGANFHREAILQEALLLGLDLMLGECLEREIHPSPGMTRPHLSERTQH